MNEFHKRKGAEDDLSRRILKIVKRRKDTFFTVLLNPPTPLTSSSSYESDPGNLISCAMMDSHDKYIAMARENHWEFSSLRQVKYSTMATLFTIHTQSSYKFIFNATSVK